MAIIQCGFCSGKWEAAFDEQWRCDCGAGPWAIGIVEYSPSELRPAFDFLGQLRQTGPEATLDAVLPVVASIQGTMNAYAEPDEADSAPRFQAFLDTLLLFFPSVVLSDFYPQTLAEKIGEDKYKSYQAARIVQTVSTDIRDLYNEKLWHVQGMDFNLFSPIYKEQGNPFKVDARPSRHMRLVAYLDNVATAYASDFAHSLSDAASAGHLERGRDYDLRVRGHRYFVGSLVEAFPSRICRAELTAYILGASLITDDYYSLAYRFRGERYADVRRESSIDVELFYDWIRSTRLQSGSLDYEQVLEFRDRHGTFGPFMREVRVAAQRELRPKQIRELRDTFKAELNTRVAHARKVMSKAHDTKAVYLTGLFSTLGGLLGGLPGAFVGGIGGRAVTQLALEYDRRIPAPLVFLVDSITPKS